MTPDALLELAGLAGHARLVAVQAAHGLVERTLVLKASPPVYNGIVGAMEDLLARAFGLDSSPLAVEAARDLSEIGAGAGTNAAKLAKAQTRIKKLQTALAEAGHTWDESDGPTFGRLLAAAYRLGQAEVAKPIGWSVGWTLKDRDALAGLYNSGIYWVGNHYGEALDQGALLETVRETMIEQGLGRAEGGRRLAATIGKQIQRSDAYWRGMAATVATRARSFGAVQTMVDTGCTRYEYVNPDDERTSDVCRELNGTLFYVKGAVQLRDQLLKADSPEAWKAISRWPKHAELLDDDGNRKKPGELQAMGIAWPPLHFHCRSSIAVRVFTPMGKGELDPLGDVNTQAPKPPAVAAAVQALADHVPAVVQAPAWTPDLPSQWFDLVDADDLLPERVNLLRLQGYTADEVDALLELVWEDPEGAVTQALIKGMTGTADDWRAWVIANPPANPQPPPSWILYVVQETKIGPDGPSWDDLDFELTIQGYGDAELAHLIGAGQDWIKLAPVKVSANDTRLDLAVKLLDNPPDQVQAFGKPPGTWVTNLEETPGPPAPKLPPLPHAPPTPPTPPAGTVNVLADDELYDLFDLEAFGANDELQKLQGWTGPQIADMLDIEEPGTMLDLGDLDPETWAAMLAAHPPAIPLQPKRWDALKNLAAEIGAAADNVGADQPKLRHLIPAVGKAEDYDYARTMLKGSGFGYSDDEVTALLGASRANFHNGAGLLKPDDSALEAAAKLTANPPGKVKAPKPPAKPKPTPSPEPLHAPPPSTAKPQPTPPTTTTPDAPKAPAVDSSQLGKPGPIASDAHGGYGYSAGGPGDPVPLKDGQLNKLHAKAWLKAQGYSNSEIDALWPDVAKLKKTWPQDPDGLRAAFAQHLTDHPPGAVIQDVPAPPAFLDPQEFGRRLDAQVGSKAFHTDLTSKGGVYRDRQTGEEWWIRVHDTTDQARSEVVANALYRRLGIEAPDSRVVQLPDGQVGVATKSWTGWKVGTTSDLVDAAGEQLAREFPADAWLANWNVAGTNDRKILLRSGKAPAGQSAILRSDNGGVFSWRSTGGKKPVPFGANVGELDSLLDKGINATTAEVFGAVKTSPKLPVAMAREIGKISDSEIDKLVSLGGFDSGAAQELAGALKARRETIRAWASAQEGKAKAAAEAARKAAEEAARAAAVRAARRAELEARIAAGDVVPNVVHRGGSLRSMAAATEGLGPQAIHGDTDKIRNQLVRLSRYRMHGPGYVVEDGYELRLTVDSGAWDQVARGMKASGARDGSWTTYKRKGLFTKADKPGDPVANYDLTQDDPMLGRGALSFETGAARVHFGTDQAQTAMRGELRIMLKSSDPESAQAELDRLLGRLGLEDAMDPPPPDADLVMRANRALWNRQGGRYEPARSADEARKRLRREKIDPDNLVVDYLGRGRSTVRDVGPGRASEVGTDAGIRFLYHEFSGDEGLKRSVLGIDGSEGGLLPTVERYQDGIFKRGASSSADLESGGANGVFTRLVGKAGGHADDWYGSFGPNKVLIDRAELDRVDWYAFSSDKYGRVTDASYRNRAGALDHLRKHGTSGSTSNEVMFRYNVPVRSMLGVAVTSEGERTAWLKTLRAAGVKTVRGQPVEEFVVVMRRPNDFSNLNPKNPVHAYLMGKRKTAPPLEPGELDNLGD